MVVVNTSESQIFVHLREAFVEAMAQFSDWEAGEEPRIVVEDRLIGISSVFFRVSGFTMTESVLRAALRCVSGSADAIELIRDRSYGMAARLLFRLTEAKKAR
jgi:hypothetical protein